MFQTKVVEKIKTHISFSIIFFPPKVLPLSDNVEKYGIETDHRRQYGARAMHAR